MRNALQSGILAHLLVVMLAACGNTSDENCRHEPTEWPAAFTDGTATRVSMVALCGSRGCPVDEESAILRAKSEIAMSDGCDAEVVSGCGIDAVKMEWGTHAEAWYYDQKSGRLVGVDQRSDVELEI